MNKLTAKAVENAAPQNREYKLADGGGLYLRVRSSGAKSWLFCFRLPGERQLIPMTLGNTSDLSLKNARGKLLELRKLVADGIDPRTARAAMKANNAQAITMQKLFDIWIEFEKLAGKVTAKWIKRHEDRWRLHLKKNLENILAKDVTRSHIATVLDTMIRKGIKEETRKGLTTLNLLLDYGVNRHYIEHNPARVLKPKDFGATASRPRTRTLSLPELRELWQKLDQASVVEEKKTNSIFSIITITAIKLLILTGARRGEIAGMRWDELDFQSSIWQLPAHRTKNRRAHTVYLSKQALELILELKPLTGNSEFVFDTHRNSKPSHIHEDTLTGSINRIRNLGDTPKLSEPFTVHDLRRTAATFWGEYLKVQPHVIERMLNHQPLNKLIATYQRAVYAEEQKKAWVEWGELIENHVMRDSGNVVVIKNVINY